MTANPGNIEILSAPAGKRLWDEACTKIAESCGGDVWNIPLWILPDNRHRYAAECALMERLNSGAISTHRFSAFLALAGEILCLPVLSVTVKPYTAAIVLQQILKRDCPEEYQAAKRTPGFIESLWKAIEQSESNGYFPAESIPNAEGSPPSTGFKIIQRRLHENLLKRRRYTAGSILLNACKKLREGKAQFPIKSPLFIGPLYQPTPLEKVFIEELTKHVDRCVLIAPDTAGWHKAYSSNNVPSPKIGSHPQEISLLRPRSPEIELDTVFSQIAEWAADGDCAYGDIRIYHPDLERALPVIESAARRYQVPITVSQTSPLGEFPGVQLLLKILNLFTSKWGRGEILEVLRSRILCAPYHEISDMIHTILNESTKQTKNFHEAWINLARRKNLPEVEKQLKELSLIHQQAAECNSAAEFSTALRACIKIIREGFETETAVTETPREERAWSALDTFLDDFSLYYAGKTNIPILVESLNKALSLSRFMFTESSNDSVEVCAGHIEDYLDVPVVMYLSLNSKVPSPRRSNPFVDDGAKLDYLAKLNQFRQLLDNGRKKIMLSCPEYDNDGNEIALSPFISSIQSMPEYNVREIDKRPWYPVIPKKIVSGVDAKITRQQPLSYLRHMNRNWSASQLDSAIQCPYLHFARSILGIDPLADVISEGLKPQMSGNIAHKALQTYFEKYQARQSFDLEKWIRDAFSSRIEQFEPHLEMDRDLENIVACLQDFINRGAESLFKGFTPEKFEFGFGDKEEQPGLQVDFRDSSINLRGKIDRIDTAEDNSAIIIDYKYKKLQSRGEFFKDFDDGFDPQILLYGWYMLEMLDVRPDALLQIFLRSSDVVGVKMPNVPDANERFFKKEAIRKIDIEERAALFESARKKLIEAAERVHDGNIAPRPRKIDRCGAGNCEYADLCRFKQKWMTEKKLN